MKKVPFVSIHGGHSGQFCSHATDSLEEIIQLYIEKQFVWVGITEHTPAISKNILYPDEIGAGLNPETLLQRFADYMMECKRLQKKYRHKIQIFAAMEIETYSGYEQFVPYLIAKFQPDYIVGSVHFVNDMGFDYSPEMNRKTTEAVGGRDELYCLYFDQQYEMIKLLKPAVVGHFDLVRVYDNDYKSRLVKPEIWQRIVRNLKLIKDLDLIMDLNLRSLGKGDDEPYISSPILKLAYQLEIAVVPGDDSHGLNSVGNFLTEGISTMDNFEFETSHWRQPKLLRY